MNSVLMNSVLMAVDGGNGGEPRVAKPVNTKSCELNTLMLKWISLAWEHHQCPRRFAVIQAHPKS
jgi:hypothetical protein